MILRGNHIDYPFRIVGDCSDLCAQDAVNRSSADFGCENISKSGAEFGIVG